ncbi:uncharacterized protein LOC110846393 [Folsomia candida]|uniref:Protein HGH1 n=1 Tax=Folsomia candida TaxID=158441 RepID=A0A226F0G9_FOLCA|nr:uncharacterized protein LOC110846393 [Folsomia candida]OXA62651.1 Protein HGH1 [Folsomia candida]
MAAVPGSSKGGVSGGGEGDVAREVEKNEGAVGEDDGDETTGRIDNRPTFRTDDLGAEGGGDFEKGHRIVYEFHEQMNNLVLEFMDLVRKLPKGFEKKFDRNELVSHLEVIGRIAYDRESEFLKIVRSDKELAIKLWDFLVYSTATVLNRIIEKKNSLLSRPVAKTYRFLKTNEDAIRLAFCAISNFVGADIDVIPVTKYAEMIIVLGPIWKEGSFDEFGRLSYFPLENLVWKVERAEHFLDVGLLSMPDLIARCRSYPFNSTQFAGLLAIILNLCQVQRANKDLLTMSLPYEEELLISHLLEGVKLENPIEVRLAVTGMLKNMAFYPESHETILNREYGIITYAIIPIAGTTSIILEQEDEEIFYAIKSNEVVDRDPNPGVRKNVIEFIYQMCAMRSTREALRKLKLYEVLREYHTAEVVPELKDLLEDVINVMIRTELEIGVSNLKDIDLTTPKKAEEDKNAANTLATKVSASEPPASASAPGPSAPTPRPPANQVSPESDNVDDVDIATVQGLFAECMKKRCESSD